MFRRLSVMLAAAMLAMLIATPASLAWPVGHDHHDHDHAFGHDQLSADHPASDRARGMVFDGLRPGDPDGPCAGGFEVPGAGAERACSHGPDPAPDGVDVTRERSTAEVLGSTSTAGATSGAGQILCLGNGSDGNRVQAVYVVASDRTDRFSSIAPSIVEWARATDAVFANTAAAEGGVRHVRWVTNPDCSLSVLRVVVSPTGDDSLRNTYNELIAQGLGLASRKYLMWVDATVYCGIAVIAHDDRPGPENRNNSGLMYARVDSGCWGGTLAAHELMHTLGGVQQSAPHATTYNHCTDEYDGMCYADGSGRSLTYSCASTHEALMDCGRDDYFNLAPSSGSYLDTHWNTARSSFLTDQGGSSTAPPPDTTPPGTPTAPQATAGDARVALTWTAPADSDVARYRVWRDGAVVSTVTSPAATDTGLTNGRTYAYEVSAVDTSGNESARSSAVSATPSAPSATGIQLTVVGTKVRGRQRADLSWNGATGTQVEMWRDGRLVVTTENDGVFADFPGGRGAATYRYRLCEIGGTTCSPQVAVTFS